MTDPTLIMLDEPMAGVNPALKQSLLSHVKELKNEGRTVLFVEHDMDMVHEISDWVVVMAGGRIIAEGTASEISGNRDVIDAYLGAHHDLDLGEMSGEEVEAELKELEIEEAVELGDVVEPAAPAEPIADPTPEATEPTTDETPGGAP